MLYEYTDYLFLLKILENKKRECLVYVVPAQEQDKGKYKRIVSDQLSGNPYHTDKLIAITAGDQLLLDLMKRGKICYSSNLTGTDFNSILKTSSK